MRAGRDNRGFPMTPNVVTCRRVERLRGVSLAVRLAKILPESFSVVCRVDSYTFGHGVAARKFGGSLYSTLRFGSLRRSLEPPIHPEPGRFEWIDQPNDGRSDTNRVIAQSVSAVGVQRARSSSRRRATPLGQEHVNRVQSGFQTLLSVKYRLSPYLSSCPDRSEPYLRPLKNVKY